MSFPARSIQPHIRQASMAGSASSAGQSPALVARVNEKKAELENLRELRDLSAAVASQMEVLEQKLGTLSDGTEGMFLQPVCHGGRCSRSDENQQQLLLSWATGTTSSARSTWLPVSVSTSICSSSMSEKAG